jgi:shikimate dehydrogenase
MRIYGLIGKSLAHSWSEEYFKNKFKREHIADCVYHNYPLAAIEYLPQLIREEPDLAGLNITIPYKTEIIKYLDRIEQEAASIEAVNCVKVVREGDHIDLVGYNTDMPAFRDSLRPLLQKHHQRALVLGTGGASRSVCFALGELGIHFNRVSRQEAAGCLTYALLDRHILADHHIIINTTPCGTYPDIEQFPDIPYQFISKDHLLYDLIYNPGETIFLKKAGLAGATVKNGLEMLQLQAELSWKTWNS